MTTPNNPTPNPEDKPWLGKTLEDAKKAYEERPDWAKPTPNQETPRTDAFWKHLAYSPVSESARLTGLIVHAEHLERELNAANAELVEARKALKDARRYVVSIAGEGSVLLDPIDAALNQQQKERK